MKVRNIFLRKISLKDSLKLNYICIYKHFKQSLLIIARLSRHVIYGKSIAYND